MAPLIADPRLRKLSFTGSTEVGKSLVEASAHQLLRVSMELGGNAPFLVFDDADIDSAVDGAMIAKMRNGGEACTSANRFRVHESVSDEFTAKLAQRMSALNVGRGTEDDVQVGPLIDATQRGKVAELVEDARSRGAEAVVGGTLVDGPGYFYNPTVLGDVPADAKLLSEEIFGPVAPVTTFTDERDAIEWANATEYGLVAYVFTRDIKRAFRVIEGLETGMVGLNQGLGVQRRGAVRRRQAVRDSGARAGPRASTSTSPPNTWRSTCEGRHLHRGRRHRGDRRCRTGPIPCPARARSWWSPVYAGHQPGRPRPVAGNYPVPFGSPIDIPGLEVSGTVVEWARTSAAGSSATACSASSAAVASRAGWWCTSATSRRCPTCSTISGRGGDPRGLRDRPRRDRDPGGPAHGRAAAGQRRFGRGGPGGGADRPGHRGHGVCLRAFPRGPREAGRARRRAARVARAGDRDPGGGGAGRGAQHGRQLQGDRAAGADHRGRKRRRAWTSGSTCAR